MKKLILLLLCMLTLTITAQKQELVYKEYQNYDSTKYTYTEFQQVVIPCEIDFNDSVITLGDKTKYHTKLQLKEFSSMNNGIIYKCYNETLKKDVALVLYVYGDYRYMEVIYTTKDKFKYRIRSDEPISFNGK